MDPNISSWPLLYQIVALAGAALTGILMWMRGSRASRTTDNDDGRELTRLREERQQNHDHQITLDMRAVRADFEVVIQSLKESHNIRFDDICKQVDDIFERLRILETSVAVLNDRQGRRR